MNIKRPYDIKSLIKQGQVLVIYGPRRVGKTTLVESFLKDTDLVYVYDSGENILIRDIIQSENFDTILGHIERKELYVIDEAQKVENIGNGLKIMVDQRKDLYVIATGSSSFDIANKIGEPLVGRKKTITLYPISVYELQHMYSKTELQKEINHMMIYGSYPQVLVEKNLEDKRSIIQEIASSFLLKDIFELEKIKAPKQLLDLVKLLAVWVGSPVSMDSLANEVGLNVNTIKRYIDLLEKTFVIYRLPSFSKNMKDSLKHKSKYYFWDNGIRNALINNFTSIDTRVDKGALFENFCVIERVKKNTYTNHNANYYYYKSYSNTEIDFIEEIDGYKAFEFKYSTKSKKSNSEEWVKEYPDAKVQIINRDTILNFLI